ncbi:hypothetical protein AB0K12_39345 [Nonomuraea sp. NPDC049419]|uniref:hypothetical protein n=1 Tax=Nonomuraea sp. NPDC049419 TaxID=3155772 RepID=UPI00343CE0B9
MTGAAGDFGELIAELADYRVNRLGRLPSDRALARAAGVQPTTIGNWLRGEQFPQQLDPLLRLIHAVRAQSGPVGDPAAAALLDEQRWRRAYQEEARRRAEGISEAVRAGQGRAVLEAMRPGWPLGEVSDPFRFGLEVHHAIDSPVPGAPPLPAYVPRDHDRRLREVVARAAGGESCVAVLVGGSSTGKTRACWEALPLLRDGDRPWRLWHPIDPTRPDAALAELHDLAPYTVVWLNEAQFYLSPTGAGEEVAAGLRELLRDPVRAPLLVLATLWPEHWNALTTRPAAGQDPHAQARELLKGRNIHVPDAFTDADLQALAGQAGDDPRLGEAAERARDGQITQYLAGVPVLLDRYEQAPPATKALIWAAMDAARLGAGSHLPLPWLADAAPGYLTDTQWDQTGDDWLHRALEYAATPCNGIPGILTPVKTGPPRNQRTPAAPASGPPLYRLADYLDQHGRQHRATEIPPIDFWSAAAHHARPEDLTRLGYAARARGLYRDAAQLFKHATAHGAPDAAARLITHLHALHPGDHRPASWAVAHAALDDPKAVTALLGDLRGVGADDEGVVLVRRAAAHVSVHDPNAVAELLDAMQQAGADTQTAVLAGRAAAHAPLHNPNAVARLLSTLRRLKAKDSVTALLARDPATHAVLDNPNAAAYLLDMLLGVRAGAQVGVLAARAAAHVSLESPKAVARLLSRLQRAGHEAETTVLAERAAGHVSLDDQKAVTGLLHCLRRIGRDMQATVLAARTAHLPPDAPDVPVEPKIMPRSAGTHDHIAALLTLDPAARDDPDAVIVLLHVLQQVRMEAHVDLGNPASLLDSLRRLSSAEQVTALAERVAVRTSLRSSTVLTLLDGLRQPGAEARVAAMADHIAATAPLDNLIRVADLLDGLREAHLDSQAITLAERAATHALLDYQDYRLLIFVTQLLGALRRLGADAQIAVLADRVAASAPLDDPTTVANLLSHLWTRDLATQAMTLAARATAYMPLHDPSAVSFLLDQLRQAGAHDQITTLAARLPAGGRFDAFLTIGDHERRFAFGREPDGSPAAVWSWADLE